MTIFKGIPAVLSLESLYVSQPLVLRLLHYVTYIQWGVSTHFCAERLRSQGRLSSVHRRGKRLMGRCVSLAVSAQCYTCQLLELTGAVWAFWRHWAGRRMDAILAVTNLPPCDHGSRHGRRGNPNHDCCLDIAKGLICVLALKVDQRRNQIEGDGILCNEEKALRKRR